MRIGLKQLTYYFDKNLQVCHLERSEAESKDLYRSDI